MESQVNEILVTATVSELSNAVLSSAEPNDNDRSTIVSQESTSRNTSAESRVKTRHNATPPEPSSTVPPSITYTPPTVLQESTPPTCLDDENLMNCVPDPLICDQGTTSMTEDHSSFILGPDLILASSSVSVPAPKSNTTTSSDSMSLSSARPADGIYGGAKGRPYALITQNAQARFSSELDRLLLQVLHKQNYKPCAQTSPASLTCSQNSAGSSVSTSSSVYAADISLDHSAPHSALSSFSVSYSTSGVSSYASSTSSNSNSASSTLHADSSPEGLTFADTPMAARFVYGSISDGREDEPMEVAEEIPDDDGFAVQAGSEDVVEDLVRPSTPILAEAVATPTAPKKSHSHFYLPNANISLSRKRSRLVSALDLSEQDDVSPGGCMRAQSNSDNSSAPKNSYRIPPSTPKVKSNVTTSKNTYKKTRLSPATTESVSATRSRSRLLAKEPASFRRAASLRSDPSTRLLSIAELKKKPVTATIVYPSTSVDTTHDEDPDSVEYPPTQPVTPVPRSPSARLSAPGSPFPVLSPAVIGPPSRRPLTVEDAAEIRLLNLIRREYAANVADGLIPCEDGDSRVSIDCSAAVDSEQEMWDALGEDAPTEDTQGKSKKHPDQKDRPPTPGAREEIPLNLGIEEDFRARVVEWILDVKPPVFASKLTKCANLRAQLTESPDTRWHAAHLLTRYFLRIGSSPLSSPIPEPSSDEKGHRILQGREALTWDIAVGCISLSVKFHRDFLHPLYPALARDYLILAPHTMEYDDLESAHRDILSAVDYCIGSCTPGAYLEELLVALPSIRAFVDARGDWEFACAEMWEILYDSLVDISYLHHPIYVVTGCALVLGIVESIVYRKKTEAAYKSKYAEAATKRRRGVKCDCEKLRSRAFKLSFGIEQDIKDVFAITGASWTLCMEWLKAMEA